MPDIVLFGLGHILMLYAAANLAAAWAWGSRRGVPESLMTVFGLAIPVGAWAMSIAKPAMMWVVPASIGLLYLLAAKPRAELAETMRRDLADERASAEDRAIARPDDGSARMTLAHVAEKEGRFDDALDHYEAAHKISDRMFSAHELASARDRLEAMKAEAGRKKGLTAHPLDAAAITACVLVALGSPMMGLAPLSGLLFVLWLRGDLGGE